MTKLEDYLPLDGLGGTYSEEQARQAIANAEAAANINFGTKITDSTMPTGGVGNLGWLSAIWKQLIDRLPALVGGKIPVDVASLSVTVDNANLEISNDAGNPIPISDAGGSITVDGSVGINNSIILAAESGYLTYRNTALSNTAVQVKNSGGSVMGWNFINVNSVAVYVKFYNLASNVTVGTSPVLLTQAVPGGSASNPGINFLEAGLIPQEVFSTGISIACVTGLADNSTTAPTTPICASVRYK